MSRAGVDLSCAADLHDGLGRIAQGTGGIDHIVEEDALLALHVADDVHDLALVGLFAALVDDGEVHAHLVGEGPAAGDGADVRGDDDHIFRMLELGHVIFHEDGVGEQVINRDVEEALDLGSMEIHGQHAVRARGLDHIGDELRGDGVAALGLAVLAGIAEIRDDGGDAAGRSAAAGVDHDEQLHQVVVDRLAGRLDQEYIAAADRFIDRQGNLAVSKGGHGAVAQRQPQLAADALGKRTVCVRAEHLDVFTVRNHMKLPP